MGKISEDTLDRLSRALRQVDNCEADAKMAAIDYGIEVLPYTDIPQYADQDICDELSSSDLQDARDEVESLSEDIRRLADELESLYDALDEARDLMEEAEAEKARTAEFKVGDTVVDANGDEATVLAVVQATNGEQFAWIAHQVEQKAPSEGFGYKVDSAPVSVPSEDLESV